MDNTQTNIRLFNDPVLHTQCSPVDKIDEELVELVSKMFSIMKQNNGVGLSANQIGVSKQVAVALLTVNGKRMEFVLLNPKIIKKEGKQDGVEGCLSAPGVTIRKRRPEVVTVQYTDLRGEIITIRADAFDAKILMHEIDHLNGKMCTDQLLNKLK